MKGRSWIKGLMGVLWLIVATTATAFAQTSDTKDLSSDEATDDGTKKPELVKGFVR